MPDRSAENQKRRELRFDPERIDIELDAVRKSLLLVREQNSDSWAKLAKRIATSCTACRDRAAGRFCARCEADLDKLRPMLDAKDRDESLHALWTKLGVDEKRFEKTVERFATGETKENKKLKFANAVFYQYIFKSAYELFEKEIEEIDMEHEYPHIVELKKQFDWSGKIRKADMIRFSGTYILYRPFFQNPKQIMICRLNVGQKKNPFEISIRYQYAVSNPSGRTKIAMYEVSGDMVPIGNNRAVAILRQDGKSRLRNNNVSMQGSQTLYFDNFENEYGEEQIGLMSGVAISALGSDKATAWPFVCILSNGEKEIAEHIVEMNDPQISDHVRKQIMRGVVDWRGPENQ